MGSPSLCEWARENAQTIVGHDGRRRPVVETDYLPRNVLGRYLNWAFGYVVRNAGRVVNIRVHEEHVTDIEQTPCGGGYELKTERGEHLFASNVVLCTGHSSSPAARVTAHARPSDIISDPYPIEEKIGALPDRASVGIEGLGLTAIDVISAGSVGRVGGFSRERTGDLRYHASGRELRMTCFSRSGLPLAARAINQKPSGSTHQPQFLTDDYVDRLRTRTQVAYAGEFSQKIDFEADVLPKIEMELELAYYRTLLRNLAGTEVAEEFAHHFVLGGAADSNVQRFLRLVPPDLRFSFEALRAGVPEPALRGPSHYRDWLLDHMRMDLAEARRGNVGSPLKAACDALRDLRPQMRRVVDVAGLTPRSHVTFVEKFVPLMNRLSVGPPASKIEELIALIEAGIVDVSIGPLVSLRRDEGADFSVEGRTGRGRFSHLVRARVGRKPVDETSLLGRMRLAGLARPFSNGNEVLGEVDVDHRHRIITASGATAPGLWAMGAPAEGSRFYTFVLPAPNAIASPLADAEQCVGDILRRLDEDGARRRQGHDLIAQAQTQERRATAA